MAFLPTYDDETEKREVEQGGARMTPMAAGPAAAGGAPAPLSSAPAGAASPGPYVNFSRYIDANRGVADSTAQSVAGSVGKTADTAQKGLQGAQAGFQQGLAAGSPLGVQRGATAGARPPSSETRNVTTTPYTAAAPVAPGQAAPAPGQVSIDEARKRAAAKYTGPTGLNISDQVRTQTAAASSQLGQTKDDSGREALLRDQYGRGGYTGGTSRLDSALVGSVGGSRFRDLRGKYGDLAGQLDAAQTAARAQAGAASTQTAATAAGYGKGVQGWEETQRNEAATAAENVRAQAKAKADSDAEASRRAQVVKNSGAFSQEQLGQMSPEESDELAALYDSKPPPGGRNGSPEMNAWIRKVQEAETRISHAIRARNPGADRFGNKH